MKEWNSKVNEAYGCINVWETPLLASVVTHAHLCLQLYWYAWTNVLNTNTHLEIQETSFTGCQCPTHFIVTGSKITIFPNCLNINDGNRNQQTPITDATDLWKYIYIVSNHQLVNKAYFKWSLNTCSLLSLNETPILRFPVKYVLSSSLLQKCLNTYKSTSLYTKKHMYSKHDSTINMNSYVFLCMHALGTSHTHSIHDHNWKNSMWFFSGD